jgi:hypothetical protein
MVRISGNSRDFHHGMGLALGRVMRLPAIFALSGLAFSLSASAARAEEPREPSAQRASLLPRYYTIPSVAPSPGNRDAVYDEETGEPMTRGYGWQVLAIDTVAYGSGAAVFALGTEHRPGVPKNVPLALAVGAGVSYLIGSPILHLAKGHPDKALKSFAARLGFAFLGGALPLFVIAGAACSNSFVLNCSGTIDLAVAGAVFATPAGTAVDAAVIAREPVTSGEVAARGRQLSWTLAPLVDPRTHTYGASFRGVTW